MRTSNFGILGILIQYHKSIVENMLKLWRVLMFTFPKQNQQKVHKSLKLDLCNKRRTKKSKKVKMKCFNLFCTKKVYYESKRGSNRHILNNTSCLLYMMHKEIIIYLININLLHQKWMQI